MARRDTLWFEFAGTKSTDMGVRLMDAPSATAAARRGESHAVAGRSGDLWLSDNTRSEFDLSRTCRVAASRLRAAKRWLSGAGELRFSHEPDALFDARITKSVVFRQILPGEDPVYEFTIPFTCQPDPRLYPAAGEQVFTESGEILAAPEGVYGLPRVTITGSGDFSLSIGGQTLLFTGVENGVIVDSELGDALSLDNSLLLNDKISGPLFRIEAGMNAVSWAAGGEDSAGEVTRVAILPRWRYN